MHYPEVDGRSWPLLPYPFPSFSCFYLKRPIIKSFNKTLRCTAEDSERLELKTTNTVSASFQKGGFDSRMSDYSSDSRRLQTLESSATEIQGQMSELMGMMRQLTQTRTAGAGQQEEESGGTGRGAAHNPSSGAGRVPPTAVTGYGITAVGVGRTRDAAAVEATAAREFTVHDRATSEPADTRPVLPTGVGPMIDVRRGEARDPYLAETLQAMRNRDRDEIIRMVSTRHSNLLQKNGAQRSSRQPEQAFASSESDSRSDARRGRDRRSGGEQGRGRGGRSHGGVGNNNSPGTPSGSTSSPVGTQGSSDGAGSLGGSGDGRHHIPSGRCFRCRQRSHRKHDCTTRESDFVPRCTRCTGFGREESSCPSDMAVMVMELPVSEEDLAVESQAFAATEAGKCNAVIDDRVGGEALDKQVVQYIADSAATCNMTPDADGLTNYRECSRPLGLANGEEISIVGYGDLTVNFRTDHRWVRVKMNDVAHVPQLSYNLISLLSMTLKGHTYTGDKGGVTLKLKGGETVFSPLVGKLCRQYGFRPEAAGSLVDTACATIALGKTKAPTTPTDINIPHCTFGHTHEVLLKKEQQGVNPSGELHECRGCSMAKGLRKPIARSTHTGADTLCLSRALAAAALYCQRGGVYSGGGRERGGGVKSRRKEGARLGQRVQPRQRSGGVAPGVTRNARGASGRIRSRGSGGAEGNPPTPSASPGRGGASGRMRSRGSGGAEGNPPTPSASPGRGGASGRMRSRGSGGAEGNPPTPSACPGRGGTSGRIRSRGSGGAEGNPPTPSASPGRGGASGRIRSRDSGGAEGDTPTPSAPLRRGGASGRICSRGHGGADGNPSTPAVFPGRGGASGRICSRGHGGADGNPSTPAVSPERGGASGKICSRGHGGAEGNPPTPSPPPGRADFGGINGNRTSSGNDGGDFPALARRPARDLEAFGELPVLQSGHTRSQSRGLAMGASCADDLLAYTMRTMEAEKPMEEKAAEVERAHDSLLEEQLEKAREWLEKLERRGIGPRARGVRGCRVGRQGK